MQNTLAMVPVRSIKKGAGQPPVESEKGIALAPSAKDLNPWYSEKDPEGSRETDEDKRYVPRCIFVAVLSCLLTLVRYSCTPRCRQNTRHRSKVGARPAHVHQLPACTPPRALYTLLPRAPSSSARHPIRTDVFHVQLAESESQLEPER